MKKARPHTDPARTTPLGCFRYATEFYAAALFTDDALGDESGYEIVAPAPVNYLMGHALELGLKAYLLQQNVPPSHLITRIGHDLEVAVTEAEKLGLQRFLTLTPEERGVIATVNAPYANKHFEYLETGVQAFPVFGPFQTAVERILLAVGQAIPSSEVILRQKAGRRLTKT